MSYLLIPHQVSTQTATVWVGAINAPVTVPFVLDYGYGQRPIPQAAWHTSSLNGRTFSYQRVPLENLRERTRYPLRLLKGGDPVADAEVTTLPASLPLASEKPFTVFLGSCFAEINDKEGRAGATYWNLPNNASPDIKILCGDQVYLDAPWHHYLRLKAYSKNELESRFFDIYQRAWTQASAASGFCQLLKNGSNYFVPDDHEFWNNAPNKAAYVRNSWTSNGCEEWFEQARLFYNMFQSIEEVTTFDVSPVSFFIADTRSNRKADRTQFMSLSAFDKLSDWIGKLKGPGILVMGQPIFTKASGWMGRFTDWSFPDYKQYDPLVRLISGSKKPIIILTGDVHFGRVAKTILPSGTLIMEIISSPLSLVDKSADGKWEAAPGTFPACPIPGLPKTAVQTENFEMKENHFLTLEFTAANNSVTLVIKAWPVTSGGTPTAINVTPQPIKL